MSQLGQIRPSTTDPEIIWGPDSDIEGEIESIEVSNCGGVAATYSIFHDHDGITFDESTQLRWNIPLPSPGADSFNVKWSAEKSAGKFAVQCNPAEAITFTFYGKKKI